MTLKKYLNLMLICTLICWGIWVLSLFLINPEKAGILGFILFYLSLFLAVLGTASLLGFLIRIRFSKAPVFLQISVAFRQGVWLSAIIVFLLLLKGFNLLRWWNLAIFVLFIVAIESLVLTGRRRMKSVE